MKPKPGEAAAISPYDNQVHRHYPGDPPPASALEPFIEFCRDLANDPSIAAKVRERAAELIEPEPTEDFGWRW